MISDRGERAHHFDGRIEHRVVEDRPDVGIPVRAVDVVERAKSRAPPEELHRRHAGDPLLQVGVDPRDPGAHRAVESRTLRRNHCVISTISGSTENATSASRQSIHTSTAMMPTSVNTSPKTDTTPEVNSSFSTSTSVVTRVISRPTGLRS